MQPSFTWLDLTVHDRSRMRQVLDLFTEQGTVDELGLGTLRDTLSDALFPGTSTIHTRLRYVFFVPWLYQQLERDGVSAAEVAELGRKAELGLIEPLSLDSDVEGVIGARARGTLKRLPSAVYWSALVRWGLFAPQQSQSWYHVRFDRLAGRNKGLRADDPGVVWNVPATWHPQMPSAPKGFPKAATFDLTLEEASFMRDQIAGRCAGSLLGWLVTEGGQPAGELWDEPTLPDAPDSTRQAVELARRFSLHVEGAPLLYNLMLAEERLRRRGDDADKERAVGLRAELAEWAAKESAEVDFSPNSLWTFVALCGAKLILPQLRFVEAWSFRFSEVGAAAVADDAVVRKLIRSRETTLKGSRSRFTNQGRLLDWTGRAGIGRMHFRWRQVSQLLADLHKGITNAEGANA